MKMTNLEIINAINCIEDAKKQNSNNRMPIKVSYAIEKNEKHLLAENEAYNKEFGKLLEDYSLKMDTTGKVSLAKMADEQKKEFTEKLKELQSIENDVNIHKISFEDFKDYQPTSLEMEAYFFMIKDEK